MKNSATGAAESPSPSAIREHLAKVLSSPPIVSAERLSALLRFIVEETLNGRGAQLKEARIGLDVFRRKADSYDPAIDPIVRVQMGRLRSKLRAYYEGPERADRVRIDIPLGSYVPTFTAVVSGSCAQAERDVPAPPADKLRLAVLPIVNMSPDPDNQYFCDGLTEELINHLAQIPDLRVVARTSSFQFKDTARDIREVGRLLDVSKVLEGSVRKAGNRIRVTVQLINVSDGCHLWSERYEGDLSDAAAMYCRRALSLDAHFHRPFWFLGLSDAWSGNFQAAERALKQGLELCPGLAFRSRLLGALGFVYGRWGRRQLADEVRRELDRMRETSYVPSFEVAQIETGLGNYGGALACLEHAVTHHESYAIFLKVWNTFKPLRQEPRFQALLAQIGLD